jgi:O-antigen/teichoic acid export membrane protein
MTAEPLKTRRILVFWMPLAGTWLMMAVEGPFLAAVIARLPDAAPNLAAYGVAFAFAIIVESPVIMLMSASTALVNNRDSYLVFRRFTIALSALMTGVMLIIVMPPVFDTLASWLNLPVAVASLTHQALILMLPWPGAIGYRRLLQGLLIRHDMTRRVAYGTVVRLVTMCATAVIAGWWLSISGALVGALALSVAVVAEALAVRRMSRRAIRALMDRRKTEGQRLSLSNVVKFYVPLALSSFLAMGVQPMVTFFMGQSRMALESLAVLPVLNGLTFLFRSLGLSFQDASIALLGDHMEQYRPLRNVACTLAIVTSVCLAVIAYSPLSFLWFYDVSGLSIGLTEFAIPPLKILVLLPALSVLLSFQRALLVNARTTKVITWATAIEVVGIAMILWIAIQHFNSVGVMAAVTAIVLGRICANILLMPACWRATRDTPTL